MRAHIHHCPVCFYEPPPCAFDCALDDYLANEEDAFERWGIAVRHEQPVHAHPILCSSYCRLVEAIRTIRWWRRWQRDMQAAAVAHRLGASLEGTFLR